MPQLKRLVLLKLQPQTRQDDVAAIFEMLDDLLDEVPGLIDVCSGPYCSPEELHRNFTHAFVMTFSDAAARDECLRSRQHAAFMRLVFPHLTGGDDGIIAFDFEVCDRFRYT